MIKIIRTKEIFLKVSKKNNLFDIEKKHGGAKG